MFLICSDLIGHYAACSLRPLSCRMLWAFFRGTTKHTSPPKLHMREWFKGFELNP